MQSYILKTLSFTLGVIIREHKTNQDVAWKSRVIATRNKAGQTRGVGGRAMARDGRVGGVAIKFADRRAWQVKPGEWGVLEYQFLLQHLKLFWLIDKELGI